DSSPWINNQYVIDTLTHIRVRDTTVFRDSNVIHDHDTTVVHYSVQVPLFSYVTCSVNVTPDTIYKTLHLIRQGEIYDTSISIVPNMDNKCLLNGVLPAFYDTIPYNNGVFEFFDSGYVGDGEGLTLPNLHNSGWHYKGWVMYPDFTPPSSFGRLTRPSWLDASIDNLLPDATSGILTTGSFCDFRGPDDSNKYSMTKRVPKVPGEDFLQNLPPGVTSIVLADLNNPTRSAGAVFITVEPDNYDYNNDSTNFPLVLLTSGLPSWRAIGKYDDLIGGDWTYFDFSNSSSTVENFPNRFPSVKVTLIRE
ncbi:MAG: hypothetical protein NTV06_07600, partial [candidate division Zixibacteria bacterium]|nr:hypothetical protein [candidate division Zixibacteria bacterium]